MGGLSPAFHRAWLPLFSISSSHAQKHALEPGRQEPESLPAVRACRDVAGAGPATRSRRAGARARGADVRLAMRRKRKAIDESSGERADG